MTEIGFYHLTRSTSEQALPALLARTLAAGQRALVVGPATAGLEALSAALWAKPAWLPHGGAEDGDPDLQPIWLSTEVEPRNAARYLFLVDGAQAADLSGFERVFDLFDGTAADAVSRARLRWKAAKEAGHRLIYWQQTEAGWQKKA